MKMRHLILFLVFCWAAASQELPPTQSFTSSDYGGDNQNWMISQADNGFIYAANNKGLLEFNGAEWHTYESPNNTIVRAVNVIENRIYTGCYEEFGFWTKNNLGQLTYTSLIPKLGIHKIDEDQIWNIIDYDEWILFQSSHNLFFYNKSTEDFKTVSSKNNIYKVFKIDDKIYYHVANEGIYIIEEGKPKLLCNDDIIINDRVIDIFEHNKERVLITRNSGLFKLTDGILMPWTIFSENELRRYNIFTSLKLEDESLILGTISNGVLKIDLNGKIDYIINQKNGLNNNTVLSLFQDMDKNVWTGLDNGINCINDQSPIKNFIDYDGILGTVYSTIVFNDYLYVGTNQGLFYKPLGLKNDSFQFVNGTAGQVLNLYNYDNVLFCGHHYGTFIIENNKALKISSILGAWNFTEIPEKPDLLLQGNYDGLYILEKSNNSWGLKNKIEGFKNSARYLEFSDSREVLVNHEYKGIFRVQLDSTYSKASRVKLQNELKLGKNSSLITYRGDILYSSDQGIFKYKPSLKTFEKDTVLSNLIASSEFTSGKIINDQTGKLWLFSQNNISYIKNDDLTNTPEIVNIALPFQLRKGVNGFENLQHTDNDLYILGTSNGYITLNLPNFQTNKNYNIYLNSAKIVNVDNETKPLSITTSNTFKHKEGLISFSYSVPEFNKYLDANYQYRLIGQSNRWSSWTKNSYVQFENLSFGDYTLEVRAKVGNTLTENSIQHHFKVNRPWYISNLALVTYFIFLLIIAYFINKAYKFYYERILKHEQIKNERALIQIKNEKLNQDIESKNRELVISTMSIVKKNEVLHKIKKELRTSNIKNNDSAVALIDDNLNNTKDWKFFKKAFNNADKDFLKKIKHAHPDLTPNDLKFCAYLRLNLSSKEIAPLLNISTKSVETKRYRLRKRLQLTHEESLVNYILKF